MTASQRSLSFFKQIAYNIVKDFADEHIDDYANILSKVAASGITNNEIIGSVIKASEDLIQENMEIIREELIDYVKAELDNRIDKDVKIYIKEYEDFQKENN